MGVNLFNLSFTQLRKKFSVVCLLMISVQKCQLFVGCICVVCPSYQSIHIVFFSVLFLLCLEIISCVYVKMSMRFPPSCFCTFVYYMFEFPSSFSSSVSFLILAVFSPSHFLLFKDFFLICSFLFQLEKELATHSSTLARRTSWTEKPGKLHFMGSQSVGHD